MGRGDGSTVSNVWGMVLAAVAVVAPGAPVSGQEARPGAGAPAPAGEAARFGFIGLHGGVFDEMKRDEASLRVRLEYVTDEAIASRRADLSRFTAVFLQHLRAEDREAYRALFAAAREKNPALRILALSEEGRDLFRGDPAAPLVERDPELARYYAASGASKDNLRRLLVYALVRYAGTGLAIEPPEEGDSGVMYHPDHPGLFASAAEFLQWARVKGRDVEGLPRAAVAVHRLHLQLQQPKVVDALIREFEREGILAAAVLDLAPAGPYEQAIGDFHPGAVIHTCHSGDSVRLREGFGVPHLHSLFFRKQSIDEWHASVQGLPPSDFVFQGVAQEVLGAIEPQVGAGTLHGGGSSEAMTPIPERIQHVVARAKAWIRLGRIANREKKVAFVYYDREMGKSELMRGSATGMSMNAPRSMVNILKRMKAEGYEIASVPADEHELLRWMMERGRQIGVWAPGVLDRLARSGQALLIPTETYRAWFEKKVPEAQRQELIKRWGPPPGRFLVWENDGRTFIVVPRIDLGNAILLPQPLRGEAHDMSLVHDRTVPPPHNYLATYFWLQEEFGTDAVVHFGTHGTEFTLPGKSVGLAETDWTDIVLGLMPNINPWVINNLGESAPVRRRAYAVLVDHLVPPAVNAELSDDLLNLHNDIDKWEALEQGALKGKFRAEIARQVRVTRLDRDLHLDLGNERLPTPEEIAKVSEYLHDIHNETTPVSLHVFGEPPREDLVVPYLVTCLHARFLSALGEAIPVPSEEARSRGDREKYLRKKAEQAIEEMIRHGLSPAEAVTAAGGKMSPQGPSKEVREGFELAAKLYDGFRHATQEMDNLLAALNGRYVPPGPGGGPDRNPGVVPTGRNMYLMNPEEVPSRASWEIGKALVDQFLAQQVKAKGRPPQKVGFTLSSFATFQDFGVMEAQILYLLGARPVWDKQNLVTDVELISAQELGRPRVDVFIAIDGYYRDVLPSRIQLIDKAVRLVADVKEQDNAVFRNCGRVRAEMEKAGIDPVKSGSLSRARLFGYAPGEFANAGYYYLVERSGEWADREELIKVYLEHVKYVYTEGFWGVNAPEAYDRHIQGTEAVLRSWSDRTRSPLSNKYDWWTGGSLTLAVKHLTGREPEFVFSDVRDPDRARMVGAEDALRQEFRVRLFNRKWIEGMMKEGYAGADQVAVHVSNTMGWKIMREGSVTDDDWSEIVDIYVRDSKNLGVRKWMETENPFAFQEITEILLESARKGFWKPDAATLAEVATEYAKSVARHGEGGGLRGGGNAGLEKFIEGTLDAPGPSDRTELLAAYRAKAKETAEAAPGKVPGGTKPPPIAADAPRPKTGPTEVVGQRLERIDEAAKPALPVETQPHASAPLWFLFGAVATLLVALGFVRKTGGL